MLLAHRGSVNPLLIVDTLIGGILAAGGANTLNCVADADIDKVMKRTARRPLARAAVPTRNALVLGLVLSVGSFFWLWWTTNLLSGLLAVATIAFYVFIYTLLLKRRTSQNVVWGGAAGSLVGRSRHRGLAGAGDVRDHLLLAAAAYMGIGQAVQGGLQSRWRADAAG